MAVCLPLLPPVLIFISIIKKNKFLRLHIRNSKHYCPDSSSSREVRIKNIYIYIYINFACLCLKFVSDKRQNGKTDPAQIFCGTSYVFTSLQLSPCTVTHHFILFSLGNNLTNKIEIIFSFFFHQVGSKVFCPKTWSFPFYSFI